MVNLEDLGDSALGVLSFLSPSVPWANSIAGMSKGLPFGPYLRATRPRRERSLTALVSNVELSLWQRFRGFAPPMSTRELAEQAQSAFVVTLPLDVRMMIYEVILGGMVFHLNAKDPNSRIWLWICSRPDRINDAKHECQQAPTQRPSSAPKQACAHATGLLPLLVTCRRVYSEAISVLYSSNIFEFTQNFTAFRFLKIMVPPQRLPAIRYLRHHMRIPHHPLMNRQSRRDWTDLFEFFRNEMPGLQSLYLDLRFLEPTEAAIRETNDSNCLDWIKPIVIFATDTHDRRNRVMEVGIRGITHNVEEIYESIERKHAELSRDEIVHMACVTLHKRIRDSLALKDG